MLKGQLKEIVEQGIKLTPMMAQFVSIKREYPDTLLLFRMGDFYELFFEDASQASEILGIAQTTRGKLGGIPIPMAGIPHHAASTYIDRITSKGLKAAICEQVQDPKEAVGIVKRAVTQVVSPGIPYDIEKTNEVDSFYMASALQVESTYYLAFLDFTSGQFLGFAVEGEEAFLEKLQLYRPKEFLSFPKQWANTPSINKFIQTHGILPTQLNHEYFDQKNNSIYVETLIPHFTKDPMLNKNPNILGPIGALGFYVASTQMLDNIFHVRPIQYTVENRNLRVTLQTLQGLEILPKGREYYRQSLLGFIDKTKTSIGQRQLKDFFINPSQDAKLINQRIELIGNFISNIEKVESIREQLLQVRDIERILTKASTLKINTTDLFNLANSVHSLNEIKKILTFQKELALLSPLETQEWKKLKVLTQKITTTFNDELGASLEKGNLIKAGAHKQRDHLAKLNQNAEAELFSLEKKYRKKTKITTLKIKYNQVAGYFIEVSKGQVAKVPKNFTRKQTLTNSERYLTPELEEFAKEILNAKEKLEALERKIFEDVISELKNLAGEIHKLANFAGAIDIHQSFSWIAHQENFVAPTIKNRKQFLKVEGTWHPLIRHQSPDSYVAHNLILNSKQPFGLLTGPNMAGKTTVMREMAIVQFLAQLGTYVPAKKAELGVCDTIFSRLGAHDNILQGQSTFMVEMSETATILRHATDRSLIILDEVGRGTSTYDGLSIAWSLVEYFTRETKALTLFSTHYHELIELVEEIPTAKNLTVETRKIDGEVHFLYNLIESAANQSFGIHVAKLAGLPPIILHRSAEILKKLEDGTLEKPEKQLDFLRPMDEVISPNEIESQLRDMDLLNLTPIQALNKLEELKSQLH